MKTNLLIITIISALVFFSIINSANAQNVNIPNANFKAALVGNSSINTNADTEIQISEAAAYTGAIIVNAMGIADLTGIEAFTAIDTLSCYFNQLTSVNIAACTALTYFDCDYNQLTNLSVSSNTALTGLYCTNNMLTGLNISSNTSLILLGCGGNRITSLNVSTNTALTTLVCFYDSIASLDVSANTALRYFDCSYNKLTSLNVRNGNNTNLTGFNAKHNANLFCIEVDNAGYMNTNWPNGIDVGSSYNLNCPLAINEISSADKILTVYPNPFHSSTTLIISAEFNIQIAELIIYDILGNVIQKSPISNRKSEIKNLSPGIYFMKVSTGEKVYTKKLIVE